MIVADFFFWKKKKKMIWGFGLRENQLWQKLTVNSVHVRSVCNVDNSAVIIDFDGNVDNCTVISV